jgi:hypothetical protein
MGKDQLDSHAANKIGEYLSFAQIVGSISGNHSKK